jgi:hypothetical protein
MKKIIAAVALIAATSSAFAFFGDTKGVTKDFSLQSTKMTTTNCTTNGNRTSCTSW